MIVIYYCKDCKCEFRQPIVSIETHGLDSPPYENVLVCPYCGGTNYNKTIRCSQCGEIINDDYIELEDGSKVCQNCYLKVEF